MRSNKTRSSQGHCVYLLNGRRCPDKGCEASHDPIEIKWKREKASTRPCPHRKKCVYLYHGACCFSHSDDHLAHVETEWAERFQAMTEGLVELEPVRVPDEPAMGTSFAGITDVRHLASFNKVADGEIAVPGNPPRFIPPTRHLDLPKDEANKTVSREFPQYAHPLEPLVRSVEAMQPGLDLLSSTDILSNAGNLRKLFDLLSNEQRMSARFELELRGDTLLISRWGGDPDLRHSYGRGVGFERATCQYDDDDDLVLHNGASHHRVVAYTFGGLRCVVQSEVDAYFCRGHNHHDHTAPSPQPSTSIPLPITAPTIPTGPRPPTSPTKPNRALTHKKTLSDPLPLRPSRFSLLALDDPGNSPFSPAPPPSTRPSPTLLIHHTPLITSGETGTKLIPPDCLLEIKTRNALSLPFSTSSAQLYFARRTQLFSAAHRWGVFTPPLEDMTRQLGEWEGEMAGRLGEVVRLLRGVREQVAGLEAREGKGGRWALVCEGGGEGGEVKMGLWRRDGGEGGLLPP
ncbi:hypothetical protein C8A05DRAFT_19230 [Staphylotrichum tortipilum]|uniref:Uncharacterized protein n=1 Tax=Staphylotrichum tortipilum TaxID=2831512 RepID=A0AAN6RPF0_9PEZI|nr:hypothetical protein C8A05DRAFT_19230 [Staphylotrichum longicolle]